MLPVVREAVDPELPEATDVAVTVAVTFTQLVSHVSDVSTMNW